MISILRTLEFEHWFIVQSAKTQALVESRLFRVEYFEHLGDCRSLGDGLNELKWKSGLRIYFASLGNSTALIIYAGDKNGQKRDIQRAKSLLERYRADKD